MNFIIGFFFLCWNCAFWPQLAAQIAFFADHVRAHCCGKNEVMLLGHVLIFLIFAAPGIVLPLGVGPIGLFLAWVPAIVTSSAELKPELSKIYVPRPLHVEQCGCVIGIRETVGSRLVDRSGARTRRRIRLPTCV